MKNHLLLIVFVCLQSTSLFSQSNPLDKKMEKVYAMVEKEKFNDATEYLEKILEESPEYGKGWDYLSKLRYKEYKDSKSTDGIFDNISVTTKDKKGKKTENDSLSNSLVKMLSEFSPSKIAYNKYIYTFRQALLVSDDAYQSSALLRNLNIDSETDTAVCKKALKYYNDAESEFAKKIMNLRQNFINVLLKNNQIFLKPACIWEIVFILQKIMYSLLRLLETL